ncbi:hypothetical protein [Roseivirga sp.]|uniref:hypothetical protein n=1 Tax=Roseivirga sp. TaxID=1964215 RepID=UPI003B8AC2C9
MNKTLTSLCLIAGIAFTSCNSSAPKIVYESDSEGISVEVWKTDSNLHYTQSHSSGKNMMTADGTLQYILENLTNSTDAELDIENIKKGDRNYRIEIRTTADISVNDVINQVISDWMHGIDIDVFYGIEPRKTTIFTISDNQQLAQNEYQLDKGTTSKIERKRALYSIQGNLNILINTLEEHENTGGIDITEKDWNDSTTYLFELDRSKGYDGIVKQLQEKYGISLKQQEKSRNVLRIG